MKVKWTPSTIGALVIITGGIVLRVLDIDAEMWSLVILAAGFLFGEQYDIRKVERKVQMKEQEKKED